jgi:hypothetical protein
MTSFLSKIFHSITDSASNVISSANNISISTNTMEPPTNHVEVSVATSNSTKRKKKVKKTIENETNDIETKKKKFECTNCKHIFDRKSKLEYHVNHQVCIWNNNMNLYCVFCNKKFRTKFALKKHLYKHNIHHLKHYKVYLSQSSPLMNTSTGGAGTIEYHESDKKEDEYNYDPSGWKERLMPLYERWNTMKEAKTSTKYSNILPKHMKSKMEELYHNVCISVLPREEILFFLFTKFSQKDWSTWSHWITKESPSWIQSPFYDEVQFVFQQWIETMILLKKHHPVSEAEWQSLFDFQDVYFLSDMLPAEWFPKLFFDSHPHLQNEPKKTNFRMVDKFGIMEIEYQRMGKKLQQKLFQSYQQSILNPPSPLISQTGTSVGSGTNNEKNSVFAFSKYKSYLRTYHDDWLAHKKEYSQQPFVLGDGHLQYPYSSWIPLFHACYSSHQWKQLMNEVFFLKRYPYTMDFMEAFARGLEHFIEDVRLFRKQGWNLGTMNMDLLEEKIKSYYVEKKKLIRKCVRSKYIDIVQHVWKTNPLSIGKSIHIDTEPKPNVIFSKEIPNMFEIQFN